MENLKLSKLKQLRVPPPIFGLIFVLILLVRNGWLYWNYSFAFYPDSTLYVHLGANFLKTLYFPTSVTFLYPLLNALTNSSNDPSLLLWFQMILNAVAGGFFIFVISRKSQMIGLFIGCLLVIDLISGALSRTILTDGIFATLNLLAVGILLFHYDRRENLPEWELFLAGGIFAAAVGIRPSNIFLAVIFPPIYFWLTRSWKKTLSLTAGFLVFFLFVGLINLKGNQKFYILASGDGYTGNNLAFPLFVYKLFSPENGPASKKIDQYIQSCYPGLDYSDAVDRSEGGAFDTVNNMNLMTQKFFPCIKSQTLANEDNGSLFPTAYWESLVSHPDKFIITILKEVATFLRYGNPYMLRVGLNPSINYGCSDIPWCDSIRSGRSEWNYQVPAIRLYEKAASKVLQGYLTPVGIIANVTPDKYYSPYLISWMLFVVITVVAAKGRERFIAMLTATIILYTAVIVVVGLGFTERYASMLSPIHTVLSGIAWMLLFRWLKKVWRVLFERGKMRGMVESTVNK